MVVFNNTKKTPHIFQTLTSRKVLEIHRLLLQALKST